jgi:phosphoribosylformimino-5-aminoimidazole carboxamide ribotide isomerase
VDLLPAIDLAGGRVVRLLQGRFDESTDFGADPEALADRFATAGCSWLHVIDLDAARTGARPPEHAALITRLARRDVRLQVGGGLRTSESVEQMLASGVERVLVGTLALREPEVFAGLVERHGARICLAADSLSGSVRVAGWTEDSGAPTVELVRRLSEAGCSAFLVTAIERDGTLEGPDLALLAAVRAATPGTLLASGGVGSAHDLRALRDTGCDGAVVGRALLSGELDVSDALRACGPDG